MSVHMKDFVIRDRMFQTSGNSVIFNLINLFFI